MRLDSSLLVQLKNEVREFLWKRFESFLQSLADSMSRLNDAHREFVEHEYGVVVLTGDLEKVREGRESKVCFDGITVAPSWLTERQLNVDVPFDADEWTVGLWCSKPQSVGVSAVSLCVLGQTIPVLRFTRPVSAGFFDRRRRVWLGHSLKKGVSQICVDYVSARSQSVRLVVVARIRDCE